ncbi:response regulator transcription factor [Microbacterium sp. X-17]|uniref:response regulator transcription factor n=1 Tax=Microbacterium sp. X-17 TaxID=3144404 RepID=UPI0031F498CE
MSDQGTVQKTAVIVEDDPDVRHLVVEVLEAAGFSTISVGNGIDGVRAVIAYQPFLTTLDVNMPGIDGFEAARRIRAQSDSYIIMITGLTEEADVVLGLAAGADDYIVKPFRPREFRARVEALLRRPRPSERQNSVPQQESHGPSFPGARPATQSVGAPQMTPPEPTYTLPPQNYGTPQPLPGQYVPAPAQYVPAPAPAMPVPPPAQPAPGPVMPAPAAPVQVVPPQVIPQQQVPQQVVPPQVVPQQHVVAQQQVPQQQMDVPVPKGGEWMVHRDLRLDPESRVVLVGDREIELTRTEFDLLATLLESKRRVRSKADLTLVLRGESYVTSYLVGEADKRAIEAHMTNLRRKLGDDPTTPRYIETVRGVGYRLTSEAAPA